MGGIGGKILAHTIPEKLRADLPALFGFCSTTIGVNSIVKAKSMTVVVLAILAGFIVGYFLHLDTLATCFFRRLVKKLHLGTENIDMELYITVVALFCCSGFGWYSTLIEGIAGDPSPGFGYAFFSIMDIVYRIDVFENTNQ